jgi:2-dehydropantoate 2-reductase
MHIAIFGAGSLGIALGGLLARTNEVVLIGRRPQVKEINTNGLTLVGDRNRFVKLEAHERVSGLMPPELLIVTTKAYDTADAVEACRAWVRGETLVLTLQNGLGNLELLRAWKGSKAIGGTTTMGATLLSPDTVRISGMGMTIIGADVDHASAAKVASAFSEAGVPTTVKKDILCEIWAKAVVSACINPTTAVLRVPNGKILASPIISRFVTEVCWECVKIARAEGIRLSGRSMKTRVRDVAADTARNLSSMLQDVERGKRTEIDQINGAFCIIGERDGVPAPLNKTLVAMIGSLESLKCPQKG